MKKICIAICLFTLMFSACNSGKEPAPYGALPSERQMTWYPLELYCFVHFNMNTFTDKEWGFGDEEPLLFNPAELDCKQWVSIFKEAGFKGVIITAKHHDGFCLWPTATTEHSVKSSPWQGGNGDLIKELSDACRECGLKFGVYLSPWDRNSPYYGKPEYQDIFKRQLTELLSNYGEIFEVWFDGANGGTGYYGGANENRKIDRENYYKWPEIYDLVRELQPNTVIFSDSGPDVRWVGNESGYAGETNWSTLNKDEFYPGISNSKQLTVGQEDGTHWVPAEVDVSIRPGWYYHKSEDQKVKTLSELMDIYYNSVGRNASLLLNIPADKRGLIANEDIVALRNFGKRVREEMKYDLAQHSKVVASGDRGKNYSADKVIDGDNETFWGLADNQLSGTLTFTFDKERAINRVLLQEPIRFGQRVMNFSVEAWIDKEWKRIAEGTTIGYKRILRMDSITTQKIRINIEDAKAAPLISTVSFYFAP